jgi:hypothetical protein
MGEVKMKLKDLAEFANYEKIKVISSKTGKVLIHSYNKEKHKHLGDLEITGIFTEFELNSGISKNWCRIRLVCWAYEDQYKQLKEARENA